jgi:hypothetical protein
MTHTLFADLHIEAPVAVVWDVLSSIQDWPQWTTTVSRVEAPGQIGMGSRVLVVQPRLKPATWQVTEWIPRRGFAWESSGWGYKALAEHRLERAGGGCRVWLTLTFSGALSGLITLLWGGLSQRYLGQELDCLRRRCTPCADMQTAELAPHGIE